MIRAGLDKLTIGKLLLLLLLLLRPLPLPLPLLLQKRGQAQHPANSSRPGVPGQRRSSRSQEHARTTNRVLSKSRWQQASVQASVKRAMNFKSATTRY